MSSPLTAAASAFCRSENAFAQLVPSFEPNALEFTKRTRPNRAVTLAGTVTEHAPMPLHAPSHPLKCVEPDGIAVSTTVAPAVKVAAQIVPQLMPDGTLDTTPPPDPRMLTLTVVG